MNLGDFSIAVALRGDRGLELDYRATVAKICLIAVALRGDRGLEPQNMGRPDPRCADCGRSSGRSRIGT